MVVSRERIAENLAGVRERLARAAERCGRTPADVVLVAVVKGRELAETQALVELGVVDLGESRPQELWRRAGLVRGPVRWHLVGHLQRNKARRTLPLVEMIHSADSLRLLEYLNELAGELGRTPRVLIEVNTSGEAAKHGFAPEELAAVWEQVVGLEHLRVEGLMTMAAWHEDAEGARPSFAALRGLRERLEALSPARVRLEQLSMGMSHDFEVAVEEGATMVRIGSALFRP